MPWLCDQENASGQVFRTNLGLRWGLYLSRKPLAKYLYVLGREFPVDFRRRPGIQHASQEFVVLCPVEVIRCNHCKCNLVNVMDGFNRDRFAEMPEILAEWASASNVFGPIHASSEKPASEQPKPVSQEVTPAAAGEARPAA
jgi:hypothetical protein